MKKKKIAITGGIGSGKSTVSNILRAMHYPVYSCDEINKGLWDIPSYLERLKTTFPECLNGDILDKKKLATLVFQNEGKRAILNSIAHPIIMETLMIKMEQTDSHIIFAEVPLLFEGNYEHLFDETILVKRSMEERISSVMKRDGISKSEVIQKISTQFDGDSIEGKERLQSNKTFIIENLNDIDALKKQIQNFIKRYK